MRTLFVASALAVLAEGGISQPPSGPWGSFAIRGVVTDSSAGQPVRHAAIRAWRGEKRRCSPPAEFAALADNAGRFELAVPATGLYFVCAGAIGYAWRGAEVTLPSDSTNIVSLRLPQQTFYVGQ